MKIASSVVSLWARQRASLRAIQLAGGLLLVRCGVTSCPDGTVARADQCVRLSAHADGGADASTDAGADGGDAGADGAGSSPDGSCDEDRFWSGERCALKELYVDGLDGDDAQEGTRQQPLKSFKQAMRVAVGGQIVNFEALD